MNMSDRVRHIQLTLGITGLLVGLLGFVRATDVAFSSDVGAQIGWPSYEIRLMSYNRLGALLTLGLAAVGLVAAMVRRPALGWVAATGFALLAVQVIVQWRPEGSNLVGSHGSNLAFALFMAIGFAVTAAAAGPAAMLDQVGQDDLSR